jgi:hypothetical protein
MLETLSIQDVNYSEELYRKIGKIMHFGLNSPSGSASIILCMKLHIETKILFR